VKRRSAKDVLVEATRSYGLALKDQHRASAAMHRAISRQKTIDAVVLTAERKHDAACDALGAAEHYLLICAAVVGGWSRKRARRSV